MKKLIALLLTLALLLSLTACGGGNAPGESTASNQSSADPGEQTTDNTETQPQEAENVPFGQYHTEEELLAMLESGDFAEYLSVDPEVPTEPVDTDGDEPYSGFSNAITFTDGGDAEGVEFTDFMEELSPEQRAEWEEMEQAMSEERMEEMLDGMEEMSGMEDLEGAEGAGDAEDIDLSEYGDIDLSEYGIELPEGYEQYLP